MLIQNAMQKKYIYFKQNQKEKKKIDCKLRKLKRKKRKKKLTLIYDGEFTLEK